MRYLTILLLATFLVFITSCGYRTKGSVSNGDHILITPENQKYNWTNLGWNFVTDMSRARVIGTIDGSSIIIPENSPNDNILIIYDVNSDIIIENPPIYAKEGYDLPFFDVSDEIESLYFISSDELHEWYKSDDYSEFISKYQVDVNIDSFISSQVQIEDYGSKIGILVYKFKNTGDIYFTADIRKVNEDDSMLCVIVRDKQEGIQIYAFPKDFLIGVLR